MKKLKFVLVLSLLVAGLSVSPALADEHVNLWPIYIYENGAHDLIWPLGKYKSTNEWRFFPIIKDRSLFCIFPEFWFGSSEFAVLPFYARYDFSEGILFPVLGWEKNRYKTIHSIFPLYWYSNRPQIGNFTFWAACGMGGYVERDGKMRAHWALPLYCAWNNGDFFSIPYSKSLHYSGTDEAYFCGLFGRTIGSLGTTTDHWFFPFYGKIGKEFISIPYYRERLNEDSYNWFSLPLLSGGEVHPEKSKGVYLLGLAGYCRDENVRESWCLPFYFYDNDGLFVTPLYGHTKSSQWCFPLWYRDEKSLFSPLWYHTQKDDGGLARWGIPPLLSGGSTKADGSHEAGFLLGLGGATWGGARNKRSSWAFPLYYEDNDGRFITPLYYYDGVNGDLATILYGRDTRGDFVTRWWATPLVGTYSGSKTGGWLFPLFNRKKDNSYDADLKRLDSPTIPEDITFSHQVHSWTNALTQEVSVYTNVVESVQVWSHIRGSFLLGSDCDRSVRGRVLWPFCGRDHGAYPVYELSATSKGGNSLIFNRYTERSVCYDIHTRQKTYERLSSQTTALCGLLYDNSYRILSDGHSSVHTSILGKLWERKEEYGRVTVDAFPAFSYEKKSNGSTMTSFLWRLYRYGVDMEKGITLDLFFIPICRPR